MSYQQELRKLLGTLSEAHNFPSSFEVTIARPGTFEMKVVRQGAEGNTPGIFDLSNGLTPRVQRAVGEWFVSSIAEPPPEKDPPAEEPARQEPPTEAPPVTEPSPEQPETQPA